MCGIPYVLYVGVYMSCIVNAMPEGRYVSMFFLLLLPIIISHILYMSIDLVLYNYIGILIITFASYTIILHHYIEVYGNSYAV